MKIVPWALLALLAALLPTQAATAQAPTAAEAREFAEEAYLYAYPLVLMDVSRQTMTAAPAAMNRIVHHEAFPDHRSTWVVRPNADTLYSTLWFDVSREPLVLGTAEAGGRYFLLQFLDMWTDTFATIGTRTTGNGAQRFAIVGPDWRGRLPEGVVAIRSPTPRGWMLGRTRTEGVADYPAVHRFQAGMSAVPLSRYGRPGPAGILPAGLGRAAPVEQTSRMSAEAFFTRFAALFRVNPPHANDQPVLARIGRLGFGPGRAFDFAAAPPRVQAALRAAPAAAMRRIQASFALSTRVNGWTINREPAGTYGTYYLRRAAVAFAGLGANSPEDSLYPSIRTGPDGRPLDSGARYVLHFGRGQLPPARAFWSLSVYDERQFFAENPIGRYALGDRDDLLFNADGSLDLYIQRDRPVGGRDRNWLPTPAAGSFSMVLRIYLPEQPAVDGAWAPPPLRFAD